ncbi:MAG: hypothetical protein JNM43_01480 [Planctomycetaceae bacterium]|nr:hypothetical protein [Planctomycetaceae bacterium]
MNVRLNGVAWFGVRTYPVTTMTNRFTGTFSLVLGVIVSFSFWPMVSYVIRKCGTTDGSW